MAKCQHLHFAAKLSNVMLGHYAATTTIIRDNGFVLEFPDEVGHGEMHSP